MLKKHKPLHLPIFLTVIFLLSLSIGFCFARELEVPLPGLSSDPELGDYISAIFNLLMGIAGIIAVLALIIGGVRLMTSAGNPEARGDAKKRITAAIFGMILLFSSYLIMKTINPQIIEPHIGTLPDIPLGLFLVEGDERKPCPVFMTDTTKIASGATILYDCDDPEENLPVLAFFYPGKNLVGEPSVSELNCGDFQDVSGLSFEVRTKLPGVYFYTDAGCSSSAARSLVINSSLEDFGGLDKEVRCVEIINNPNNDIFYDVVLHEEKDYRGRCLNTVIHSEGQVRYIKPSINPIYSSATIVKWNPDYGSAGDGVMFFSDEFHAGGYYEVNDEEMAPIYKEDLDYLFFDYVGSGVSEEEQEIKPNFKESPGSIRITGTTGTTGTGDYLIVLYARKGGDRYCQTFDDGPVNLKTEWITKEGKELYKIEIVPTK